MLLLVLSTRYFLQILIITRTNGDMSHFARVGIFKSGLRMTDVGLRRLILTNSIEFVYLKNYGASSRERGTYNENRQGPGPEILIFTPCLGENF